MFGVVLVAAVAVLGWQVATLDSRSPDNALVRFKANHYVGLALTLAFLFESLA